MSRNFGLSFRPTQLNWAVWISLFFPRHICHLFAFHKRTVEVEFDIKALLGDGQKKTAISCCFAVKDRIS